MGFVNPLANNFFIRKKYKKKNKHFKIKQNFIWKRNN